MVSKHLIGAVGGFLISICGGLIAFVFGPPLVKDQVHKNVALQEGGETFEFFKKLPFPLVMKVYFFNVTNPEAIHNGKALPIVKEVGPYVYKVWRYKSFYEVFNDKKNVKFRGRMNYVFDKELSAPLSQDDDILMLDVFLNVLIQTTMQEVLQLLTSIKENRDPKGLESIPLIGLLRMIFGRVQARVIISKFAQSLIQATAAIEPTIMKTINSVVDDLVGPRDTMFVKRKVRSVLFEGIPICEKPGAIAGIICNMVRDKGTKTVKVMKDNSMRFSFFNHKNTTDEGLWDIYSGVDNPLLTGTIHEWNKQKYLKTWPNLSKGKLSICNMLNGSDGSSNRPFLKEEKPKLYVYSVDICRSIEMVYRQPTEFKGIPGYRYTPSDGFLEHLGPEYGSQCFCPNRIVQAIKKPNGCLYGGALDLSPCVVINHTSPQTTTSRQTSHSHRLEQES